MIKACFVRGKYLNNFEGQNYLFDKKDVNLTAVSSLFPINNDFPFPVKKFFSPMDIPYINPGIKFIGNRIFGDSHLLFGLEKLAKDFDIFHAADPHYYYTYQLARLRADRKIEKLISTYWETIPFNNESVYKKKQIKYFSLKFTDYFICHSLKAKRALSDEGIGENKISFIQLGVDLTRFKSKTDKLARSRNFVNKNNITILFVGRLVEEKGIMDLYEAYKNIKIKILNSKTTYQKLKINKIKLRIIGDGSLNKRLQQLIQKDGLEDDVTIEKKEYKEMPKIYQEADIFVLPAKTTRTWEEQYGMVLIEAMASGLPIVAYDSGATPEIIKNKGILVKEGNISGLFTSINQLIEVKELRTKLGKMGRVRAEEYFDSEKTAKRIAEMYMRFINN